MSNMMSEIYDALRSCGAPDEQAHAAAQVVGAYESRLDRLEAKSKYQQWLILVLFAMFFAFWIVPPLIV